MVKIEQLSDDELLSLLSKDDEAAMDALFRRYYAYVCKAVFGILNDSAGAEDVAQEVFMEVWKRRKSLDISLSLKAYLRRSAVNRALNQIRSRKKMLLDELSEASIQLPAPERPGMESQEFQVLVEQAIAQLPERCRLVFKLSRDEDMSYKEIAEHLEISVKTVENQIVKALKMLREGLQPFMDRILLIGFYWIANFL